MPAPKGHERYGGRAKGTKNVATLVREQAAVTFSQSLEESGIHLMEDIKREMALCSPYERATILLGLLPYKFPKMKQVEFKHTDPLEGMSKAEKVEALRAALKFMETEPNA